MNEMELKENIKKELRWWKWVVGTAILVIVFLSNLLSNKLFYEEDIKSLKIDVRELKETNEILSYNLFRLCEKNGLEIKRNPLKNR